MSTPNTVSYSGELLEKMKKEGSVSRAVLVALRAEADKVISEPTYKPTERKLRACTKNPHDYASMGIYWWPNPDTPDGLPYVRRDGEQNPEGIETVNFTAMSEAVRTLALAAYYFEDKRYAEKAEEIIYDWHLNPETSMTPHAEYSQCIPGICNGRGIGIIDFRFSYHVFDSVAILESMGWIKKETVDGVKAWYNKFCDWLLTSENGVTEDTELNNHGTYYDVQVLAIAIFLNRKALVKKICTTAYKRRFLDQVEPDGSQPFELARTCAMIYSFSNLEGLLLIANMASRNGYPEYTECDKAYGKPIIRAAGDFILPYALDVESFPYKEIHPDGIAQNAAKKAAMLDAMYPDCGYGEISKKLISGNPVWLAAPLR